MELVGVILPGLWHDLGERAERLRNGVMRTVLRRFASINEFEAKVSSQNGEDGVIAEIFRRIGTTNRFFVEFGVSDGKECNTAALAAAGWPGLMLEGDAERFSRLQARYAPLPAVVTAFEHITAENIAALFVKYNVPDEFDLLSIDVDGNDYWLWKALGSYHPRVVVIEYNAAHPPPQRWVLPYDPSHRWDKTTYYGASLTSLASLADSLGYALIGTESTGVNAFFVRADEMRRARFRRLTPDAAYHAPRYYGIHGQLGHVPRTGPFVAV